MERQDIQVLYPLVLSHQSPNLAPIVQEIVERSGWNSGNPIVFLISGSGTRTAESYNGEPAAAPLLHIEYTTSPPPGGSIGDYVWEDMNTNGQQDVGEPGVEDVLGAIQVQERYDISFWDAKIPHQLLLLRF